MEAFGVILFFGTLAGAAWLYMHDGGQVETVNASRDDGADFFMPMRALGSLLGVAKLPGGAMDAEPGGTLSGEALDGEPDGSSTGGGGVAPRLNATDGTGWDPSRFKVPGLRNNNPGNIRYVASLNWVGQVGEGQQGFAEFETPQDGIRAMVKNLLYYQDRLGLKTPREIFSRWAPVGDGDNNPNHYAAAVANSVGIGIDDPIDLRNAGDGLIKFVNAVIKVENAQNPYPLSFIRDGIKRALEG